MERPNGITWEDPTSIAKAEDYVLHKSRRYVLPYFFDFVAHVKKRWAGIPISEFFANEFKQRKLEYYVRAITEGRIRVGSKVVQPSYRLRDSETITHFVHRHEPPVSTEEIRVLHEDPHVIVVSKPASMPVHPCGQYRKNTVISVLQAEHNYGSLLPIHRLDRLVSGLLILARDGPTAAQFCQEIQAGAVKKEYVALVEGVFPSTETEVNVAVAYDSALGRSRVVPGWQEELTDGARGGGEGEEGRTAGLVPRKRQKKETKKSQRDSHDAPKSACTRFRLRSTDGATSVVECSPLTGRTHQIRVHLQHLGFPIVNDPLYSSMPANSNTGPPRREAAGVFEEAEKGGPGVDRSGAPEVRNDTRSSEVAFVDPACAEAGPPPRSEGLSSSAVSLAGSDDAPVAEFEIDPMCPQCPLLGASGYEDDHEGLWLHCFRYSSESWCYECPLPRWATEVKVLEESRQGGLLSQGKC